MENPEIDESVKDLVRNYVAGLQTGTISVDIKNIPQDSHSK
jgi:hypothetical protein